MIRLLLSSSSSFSVVVLLLMVVVVKAVYLPGNTPNSYVTGDPIPIEANKMSSSKTQVPYSMYTLDFCRPSGDVINTAGKTLGQILAGDVIQNTPFDIRMNANEECKALCTKSFNASTVKAFEAMIHDEYMINLLADDLPAAWKISFRPLFAKRILQQQVIPPLIKEAVNNNNNDNNNLPPPAGAVVKSPGDGLNMRDFQKDSLDDDALLPGGYPIGLADHQQNHQKSGGGPSSSSDELRRIASLFPPIPPSTVLLFNHLDMTILYHEASLNSFRVVGFHVRPRSISEEVRAVSRCGSNIIEGGGLNLTAASTKIATQQHQEEVVPVTFSYSVKFQYSPISWATRWDAYLASSSGSTAIHWFSILNSFFVVVILAGAIGTILLRTVLRDIAQYNSLADNEDLIEESGWKQIHGDVFRRPRFSKLLATCAGTGVQVLIMIGLTLAFAVLGLLSPQNRGSLIQVMLISFAIMGWPAGYVSARFTKLFQATDTSNRNGAPHRYFTVTFLTAFLYTGVCFTTFLILNLILTLKGSSGATPFLYLFLLVLLWLGVSVPLVFFGAYAGYRKPVIWVPTRTNQIPRQIPEHPWYLKSKIIFATGGILPFGAAFSELTFIIASVWQHKFYTLFGFLTLVLLILLVTCAETSIVFTYFQLAAEDYRWWWKSFWVSAFSAVYFFAFSLLYFFNALEITSLSSAILFFGYTGLMTYTFFLVTGAVGFLATFLFVSAIYSAVKVD